MMDDVYLKGDIERHKLQKWEEQHMDAGLSMMALDFNQRDIIDKLLIKLKVQLFFLNAKMKKVNNYCYLTKIHT